MRITKEFEFEAAHRLLNYKGDCNNLHGHSYKLFVTITGSKDSLSPQGILMDFKHLKSAVQDRVLEEYDHATIINAEDKALFQFCLTEKMKHLSLSGNPTVEIMVQDIWDKLVNVMPTDVVLANIRLYETSTSYCEYNGI